MKKILITGTTGFLGSRILIKLLLKEFIVVDLIRKDNEKLLKLRNKFKNYHSIIIDRKKNYLTKIKNNKFYAYIHFATFYKRHFNISEVKDLINTNINFPYDIILEIFKKTKKIINFGSYMEYQHNYRDPQNVYAASKIFFEEILNLTKDKTKIYNIKLFETFDNDDNRVKFIPTMINSYKKNKKFFLFDKNIKLNFVSVNDIYNLIENILKKNITPGTFFVKNKKNTKVLDLINQTNKYLNKKIKFRVGKIKKKQLINKKFKVCLSNFKIEKEIYKTLKDLDK